MKRDVSIIALCDMIFILLLALSGSLSGEIGIAAYYLSYLIPIFALLILYRDKREKLLVVPKKDSLSFVLIAFVPFLSVVILISYLSSLFLGLFGVTNEVDVSGNVFYEILRHALLPSILEELLFRLFPRVPSQNAYRQKSEKKLLQN